MYHLIMDGLVFHYCDKVIFVVFVHNLHQIKIIKPKLIFYFERPEVSQSEQILSSMLLSHFTIEYGWDREGRIPVKILSAFNDKLLVGAPLAIYRTKNQKNSYLFAPDEEVLLSSANPAIYEEVTDATWTARGTIMYTTPLQSTVVTISAESGMVISKTKMSLPMQLSVFDDSIIFLNDYNTGVYQTTNDGATWDIVFKTTDGWHCYSKVIKINLEHGEDFWTLEENGNYYRLRVNNINNTHSEQKVAGRDVKMPSTVYIRLRESQIWCDGRMTIFLLDRENQAVHTFLLNGQYQCQLLSSHQIKSPVSLTLDTEDRLYVGQADGKVTLFKLRYG